MITSYKPDLFYDKQYGKNILILLFLGYNFSINKTLTGVMTIHKPDNEKDVLLLNERLLIPRNLKFHEDWNHLHVVIDKIDELYKSLEREKIDPQVESLMLKIINGALATKIEYVHEDVIKFLTIYKEKPFQDSKLINLLV